MHRWDNDHRSKTQGRRHKALVGAAGVSGIVAFAATLAAPVTASAKTLPAPPKKAQAALSTVSVPFLAATTPKSFSSAVSSLKTAVSSAGMMVLGTLNQANVLSLSGLHLKGAETFFVGNPTTGKKLFAMDPAIGVEIPVGFYLWANAAGKTEVGYFAPPPVFKAVSPMLAGKGPMFAQIASKIAHGAA